MVALVLVHVHLAFASRSPQVLSMPILQPKVAPYQSLLERDALVVPVANNVSTMYYLVSASIGTPPQVQTFIIDTGSSDIWMFAPHVCEESSSLKLQHRCSENSFNSSVSSTFQLQEAPAFEIEYGDGSRATGDYFSDNCAMGEVALSNLTMAVANETIGHFYGVMGIGYRANEVVTSNTGVHNRTSTGSGFPEGVNGDFVNGTTPTTPTLLDQLVTDGLIISQAYSLWLDDLTSSTGSILFGGVDHTKYSGELVTVPLQEEESIHTEFLVEWSAMGLTDQSGSTLLGVNESFPSLALLDSGTPFITVPEEVWAQLESYFAVVVNEQYGALVTCSLVPGTGTIDFSFGGADGPVVAVPFSELALPLYENETPLLFNDGSAVCQFAIRSASDASLRKRRQQKRSKTETATSKSSDPNDELSDSLAEYVLGVPFMRSAYLVFDLAHNEVSIAQTNFSASGISNITEIASDAHIPGASRTATDSNPPPTSSYYDSPANHSLATTNHHSSIPTSIRGYPSSYFASHTAYYTFAGQTFSYPAAPSSIPSSLRGSSHAPAKAAVTTYGSALSDKPIAASISAPSRIVDPTPVGGPFGTSYSYEYISTPLGPAPTRRRISEVSGAKTTYSQSAVTALEDKPGRVAVVSRSGLGTVDAATATATGEASVSAVAGTGMELRRTRWGCLVALAGMVVVAVGGLT